MLHAALAMILGAVVVLAARTVLDRDRPEPAVGNGEAGPPSAVDPRRTGRAGLIVSTPTASLRRLTGATDGAGVIVLSVEAGGPSDGKLERGDIVSAIDGRSVADGASAVALLRQRPGTVQRLIVRRTGSPEEIDITSRDLGRSGDLPPQSDDPIDRYVRGLVGPDDARIAEFEAATRLDPDFATARAQLARAVWDARPASGAARAARSEEARRLVNGAIGIDPRDRIALVTRAHIRTLSDEPADGLEDALRARALDGGDPNAAIAAALAHRALAMPRQALLAARVAVDGDPFNPAGWRLLAGAYAALGRDDDCASAAEAFLPFLRAEGREDEAASLRALCD